MKNQTLLFTLLVGLFNFNLFAQPANDLCSGAINLGSLPTPGSCTSGIQNGAVTTVTGTTVGATAATPYVYQNGCQGAATAMNAPSLDVWYKFTATGTTLNINLTGFPNANVALWTGACGNLGGYACSIGNAGGTTSLIAYQIQIGTTYYISIAGNTDTQTSTFTLNVDNDIDCNNCLRQSNITANPLPVNGAYEPGQVVQFCYRITQWEQPNTNWLHGVQVSMGSGWTGVINGVTLPAKCSSGPFSPSGGHWIFKPTGIGVVNGVNWGPGFYFEETSNATNPADNLGDNCSGTSSNWTFCFSLTVNSTCTPGSDLGVDINTSGDGESGSWSSPGCVGDFPTTFNAIGACCPPTTTSTSTCINTTTGTATATPIAGSAAPFTFLWTPGNQTTQTATDLAPGTYTVTFTDANTCQKTATVVVASNPLPSAPTTSPVTYCQNATTNPLTVTLSTGCTANWYGTNATGGTASSTAPTPSSAVPGTTTYYVSQSTSLGCEGPRTSLVVTINPLPVVTVNSPTICAGQTATLTASGASTYSWSPGTSTANPYSVTPTVTTTYTVTGTDLGCTSTATATVTVNPLPVVTVNSPTICPTLTAVLTANGATTYDWDSGTSTDNPYSVSPTATTTYTVVGTSLGCTGTATATVTVSNSITITVNSPTICIGGTAVLTANGATTYDWDSGTSTDNPYSVSPTVTTSYTVEGNSNGCLGSATATVTVEQLPASPTTAPISYCQNATTTPLTATATTGNTLNWYGTNATGGTASSTAPTPNSATAGTTTYYVSQTSAAGCEGPRASLIVTINPSPTVTVNSPSICEGESADLTANGATTYDWDSGTSTDNPYSVSPTATTTYTVVGTSLGCTGTATATVTVFGAMALTVNSPTICEGGTAVLTANGATSYDWDSGASTSNPYSVSPAVTTTYTLTGTSNGCSVSITATVTVNPIPIAPTTTAVDYCQNEVPVPLIANAISGNSLNWYGTNATGGTASSTAPTPSTAVPGVTTYYVSQSTSFGCEGPRASLDVTVISIPTAPSTTPANFCLNEVPTSLIATPDNGCVLNWYGTNATGGTASSIAPTPSTSTVNNTTYYVSQTNSQAGCEGPRASLLVTINPLPSAPSTLPIVYCVDDAASPLTATESMLANGTPYNLNWYGTNSTGGVSSSSAPTPSTASATSTSYYVSQTNPSTGCEGPRAAIVVTVTSLIPSLFTQLPSTCEGETPPVFENTSLNSMTGSWSPSMIDNTTAGTTNYTFYPNPNQCAATATMPITINPKPDLQIHDPKAVCFPNPVDITPLEVTAGSTENGTLSYWLDQSANNSLPNPSSISTSNVYYIKSTTSFGCTDIKPVNVTINSLPIAEFTPNPIELDGLNSTSTMMNSSINAVSYVWNFGDGTETSTSTSPTHEFPGETSGTYTITLIATSQFDCLDTAFATVNVKEVLIYYVPNTFTPDNDMYNETFLPVFTSGYDPYNYSLFIFNRWGDVIFESHDAKIGWKGTMGNNGESVIEGTYNWKIEFQLKDLTERKVAIGHVNILR